MKDWHYTAIMWGFAALAAVGVALVVYAVLGAALT